MTQPIGVSLEDLNPYARRFAGRLFAAHPEWGGLASPPPWPNAQHGILYVELHSPFDARRILTITTDGGEVTVAFGEHGWHAHFGDWTGADEPTSFAEALEMIDGIVTEELALVQSYNGDTPGWSSVIAAGESCEFGNADRLELWSWLGNQDATLFST